MMCYVFFFSSRRRHTRCALVTGVQTCALPISARRRQRGILVGLVPAYCGGGVRLRGDLLRRQGRVPRPPALLRDAPGHRRFARARHPAPPPPCQQPVALPAPHPHHNALPLRAGTGHFRTAPPTPHPPFRPPPPSP